MKWIYATTCPECGAFGAALIFVHEDALMTIDTDVNRPAPPKHRLQCLRLQCQFAWVPAEIVWLNTGPKESPR